MRKFSFPNWIIPLWNSLHSSPTLNTFKARLDRFWENQEVRYNWKVDILYTGSRSNVEWMFWLYMYCILIVRYSEWYSGNGLDIEVHDLRLAIYTTTTTTLHLIFWIPLTAPVGFRSAPLRFPLRSRSAHTVKKTLVATLCTLHALLSATTDFCYK